MIVAVATKSGIDAPQIFLYPIQSRVQIHKREQGPLFAGFQSFGIHPALRLRDKEMKEDLNQSSAGKRLALAKINSLRSSKSKQENQLSLC